MTTADDESVANLQRALRDLRREEVHVRNLVTLVGYKAAELKRQITPGLDGWIFNSAGDDVMVCGPQGKPGFKWLKPDAKSLEARLLYALVAAIIQERGTS